jgi:catechol 2,3-dioxygenase-like lactoylglutathione lyase family enzyme
VRGVSYASKRVTEEIAQLAHGSESGRHYEVRQDMIRLGQLRQVGDGVGTQLNSGSAMILRPHQVVLTVSDLDASMKFYGRFGFSPGSRIRKNDGRERVALRAPGNDEFELKLFSNLDPRPLDAGVTLENQLASIGTRYLSLLCEDVDEFYERHRSTLNFVRAPKTGMTGCRYAFFTDPDGILLEVYQPNYQGA